MKIIWDNIREIGEYMNWVGLKKLCSEEREWGGAGVIITSGVGYGHEKPVTTEESDAFHECDTMILTPYAKELSWLYRNILNYTFENDINMSLVNESLWASCKGFFSGHKQHTAKQLIAFVSDFIDGAVGRKEAQSGYEEAEKKI